MRIALFTGNYNHIKDGVSLTLNRLVRFLEGEGVEVLIIAPTIDDPPMEHEGELIPVPSISIPGRPEYRFSLTLPAEVKRRLEAFDPDIVHIATPDLLGLKALRWARKRSATIVATYHTHFPSYLKYYRLQALEGVVYSYLRWFYSHCRHIYVPANSMIETLRGHEIDGDMRVWARGVNTELFTPAKRNSGWREAFGFRQSDIIVTFVSRLVWEKNLELFADTVISLGERFPEVRPLVVGDGPAKEGLEKMLPEAVYTGFLKGEALAEAYANSDVFLFPSDTEAFGNVTLEAMASGLPCVVADAVGSKSLVDDGKNGYLVDVAKSSDFEVAVEKLVTDASLRSRMGEESRRMAVGYSWKRINSRLLNDYKDALTGSSQNR